MQFTNQLCHPTAPATPPPVLRTGTKQVICMKRKRTADPLDRIAVKKKAGITAALAAMKLNQDTEDQPDERPKKRPAQKIVLYSYQYSALCEPSKVPVLPPIQTPSQQLAATQRKRPSNRRQKRKHEEVTPSSPAPIPLATHTQPRVHANHPPVPNGTVTNNVEEEQGVSDADWAIFQELQKKCDEEQQRKQPPDEWFYDFYQVDMEVEEDDQLVECPIIEIDEFSPLVDDELDDSPQVVAAAADKQTEEWDSNASDNPDYDYPEEERDGEGYEDEEDVPLEALEEGEQDTDESDEYAEFLRQTQQIAPF
eukprot:TRINITY_DN102883_c0_g1_i1.p2 TRINITY_DN102883_c0_g1~~TRINITY_DN102883_c0_g1_i1.p2  ORF type:complete len:310 (-),score=47.26 TRINITY_DN102883_c0_g1_i1:1411-2340(-)